MFVRGAMPNILYRVTLAQEERAALKEMTTRGKHGSQKVLNALILLSLPWEG
jgi:hypothetical protein